MIQPRTGHKPDSEILILTPATVIVHKAEGSPLTQGLLALRDLAFVTF